MTNLMAIYLRGFAVFLLLLSTATTTVAVEELNTEGLIQRHLNSIGTAEARASVKSRVVEGRAAYRVLVGGSGQIDGKCVMVSERDRLQALFKINAIKYHGEKFVRNGDKTFVAGTYDDGTRSEFGQFLRSEDIPLREGTLGGVWSAGWPLLDLSSHNAKLHYDGLKKVDGQPLHAATYRGKKSADMQVVRELRRAERSLDSHHPAADVDSHRGRNDRATRRNYAANRRPNPPVNIGHCRHPFVDKRQLRNIQQLVACRIFERHTTSPGFDRYTVLGSNYVES